MGQGASKRVSKPGSSVSKDDSPRNKSSSRSLTLASSRSKSSKGDFGLASPEDARYEKEKEWAQKPLATAGLVMKQGSLDTTLSSDSSHAVEALDGSASVPRDPALKIRQRRSTAPELGRASSLGHISDRAPLATGSTFGSDLGIFYTDFRGDRAAYEASKLIRKSMRKYTKKLIAKVVDGNESSNDWRYRLRVLRPEIQSNSTSTLFVDQTVSQPDLDQILRCAATAIHTTFVRILAEPELPQFDPIFDEKAHPLTSQRISSSYKTKLPRVTEIYDFLRAFFKAAVLKADVAIVGMVYISRLHNAGLTLQPANWKRVILGAIMLASKVWDDQAVWNADYCTVLPDVTVDSMNQLERTVLELLYYNVGVSSAEYVQHYLELRNYAMLADACDGIPLSPLNVRRAHELDALSSVSTPSLNNTKELRRAPSSDPFEPRSRHAVIP